jgi:pimeloyl-ACP methyl ester carboxylesterase
VEPRGHRDLDEPRDEGRFAVSDERVHRVVSDDGTEIAGWIRGDGPPLVLVPGGNLDGNPDASLMRPHLEGHFTCYFMSPRGLGLSADHPDVSRERTFEDFAAFVRGIGEPVSAFGHSAGAVPVLGGAALTDGACRSIALYEPALPVSRPVMHDDAYANFCAAVAEDRQTDAFRIVVDDVIVPTTDEEKAFLSLPGVADFFAATFPMAVRNLPDMNRPIDTGVFERLVMPVLLIEGTRSSDHYKDAVRLLSETLHDARVIQVDGAGHLGPTTHAQAVAEELVAFFTA